MDGDLFCLKRVHMTPSDAQEFYAGWGDLEQSFEKKTLWGCQIHEKTIMSRQKF